MSQSLDSRYLRQPFVASTSVREPGGSKYRPPKMGRQSALNGEGVHHPPRPVAPAYGHP